MGYLVHTGRKRLERNTRTAYLLKFIKISTKVVFKCVLITYRTNNISHNFPILFSSPRLSVGFLKYKNTCKHTYIHNQMHFKIYIRIRIYTGTYSHWYIIAHSTRKLPKISKIFVLYIFDLPLTIKGFPHPVEQYN